MSQRKDLIRSRLSELGEVTFADLAEEFDVSEMTIRRDIRELEDDGVARRTLGGAIAVELVVEPSFASRASRELNSKRRIAELAVANLHKGEVVIIDSGSTALAVAKAIRGKGLGLTVLTPSILAAVELAEEPDTTVLMVGGVVRPEQGSLIGAEAIEGFQRYNCDTYIMGVAGVDNERGFTDYHRGEGAVKRAAVAASRRMIAVVDSSKFNRVFLSNVAPLSSASIIITDAPMSNPALRLIEEAGIEVLSAHVTDESEGNEALAEEKR